MRKHAVDATFLRLLNVKVKQQFEILTMVRVIRWKVLVAAIKDALTLITLA